MKQVRIIKTNLTSVASDVETLLGRIDYRPKKEKILLKPNIVVAEPPENGAITHPKLMEALVQYFRKRDREVVIAEGTGIFADDRDFERLLHATQYASLRNQLGIPIINLEQVETEKIPWQYGSLHIPKLLKDYEYINVPTMKTHGQTMVTLGVKNQKGLLPMKMKKMFHKRDLHSSILALSEVIRPTLTVVDGIYCVEGNGPTGPPVGEVKRLDLLVAGTDMMAVDNVCVNIMGFEIEEIRHLRAVNDIEILGIKVGDVKSPFKRATRGVMRLGPFVFYSDDMVCTMCTVSLYKTLSKIFGTPELQQQLGSREDLREINIIMGQAKPPDELAGCTFCLGDCATKTAKRMGLPHIKGCHPNYRDIIKYLFPGYYTDTHPVKSTEGKERRDGDG
jgi:uncharacterized protein (DUF362 family)